jgi:hypothetical protein
LTRDQSPHGPLALRMCRRPDLRVEIIFRLIIQPRRAYQARRVALFNFLLLNRRLDSFVWRDADCVHKDAHLFE